MRPIHYLTAALGVLALMFAVLYFSQRSATADLNAAFKAQAARDSTYTAGLIAERDSLLSALVDSAAVIDRVRKLRQPRYLRVDGANHTLTGAAVDSLFSILDRPLPE